MPRETDHDILIELRTDIKWIKETTDKQSNETKRLIKAVADDLISCRSTMEPRINKAENTVSNLKEKWSAVSAFIGAVVAALVVFFSSRL